VLTAIRWVVAVRLTRRHQCGGGCNLATDDEFAAQRVRAEEVLDWYRGFVQLLRRLQSGATPSVLQLFCAAGYGSTEGVRRGGGVSHGLDAEPQPEHERVYGEGSTTVGDAASRATVDRLRRKHQAFGAMGGPPCKFYTRRRMWQGCRRRQH